MAAQKGRELLLQVEDSDGAGTYTTLGGLRANTFTINNEAVDITGKDDAGIRQMLEGAGTTSLDVSGEGVAKFGTPFTNLRTAAFGNAFWKLQLIIPDGGSNITITGQFHIATFEVTGEHNTEVTYSISFNNADTFVVS